MSTIDKELAEEQIVKNTKESAKPTGYVIVKYFNLVSQAYNPKNPEAWWSYAIFIGPGAKRDYEDFMNPFVTTTVGEVQLLWGSKRFYKDEEKREPEKRLTKSEDELGKLIAEANEQSAAKRTRHREGRHDHNPGRRR